MAAEALTLHRHAPTYLLGGLADAIRARKHPARIVSYIIDRNVNYTNVCVARCNFLRVLPGRGSPEGYVLGFEDILRKIAETMAVGAISSCFKAATIQPADRLVRGSLPRRKVRYPHFRLHALSPPEILHISRLNQVPVPAVIERVIAAGLDSIPVAARRSWSIVSGGSSLLQQGLCGQWLDVMREAHNAGLRSTATMMYCTVESDEERIEHLLRLRDLQDETGGFTAFITWSYQPEHTERGGYEATGVDYLRTLALARIVLDNFDNLQASWVTQGGKVGS